jgi:tRNA(fMet)-specific endonuclease VapC
LTLSLDANVLIDLANGRQPLVRNRFEAAATSGEALATCSLCAHELIYGAEISRRPTLQMRTAEELLSRLVVAPFDEGDAASAATVRAALKLTGTPIGQLDAMIAGQAVRHGWTVVTANVREYRRVAGLRLVDWRDDPESP